MQWISTIGITLLCLFIFLEDFKTRSVHVFLFLSLGLIGFIHSALQSTIRVILINTTTNILFLLVQSALLLGYLALKVKGRPPIKQFIGTGDLFFLLICCLLFSFVHFIIFYILSLLFTLCAHFIFRRHTLYNSAGFTVALAGWQALALALVLSLAAILNYDLFTDATTAFFILK